MPVMCGKIPRRETIICQLCVGRYRGENLLYASYVWEDTEERIYYMPVMCWKIQRREPIIYKFYVGSYRGENLLYASYVWEETEKQQIHDDEFY